MISFNKKTGNTMAKAQFSRTEILDKSIKLFWKNGFGASSMQMVIKTTGLKPGSIYLSFGNKEALYKASMERYTERALEQIRGIIDRASSIGEGICIILEKMLHDTTKKDFKSCLLVKTQLELAGEANELHTYASDRLGEIEALYRSYLEKEFDKSTAKVYATSLMLHIFGLRVYGYQTGSVEEKRAGLKAGLPWLPWKKS